MALKMRLYVSGFLLWVLMSLNPLYGFSQHRRPFGPLMCRQLCGGIVGCSTFWYRPSQLYCTIGNTTDLAQTKMYLHHMTKADSSSNQLNSTKCPFGSKITSTRSRINHCLKYFERCSSDDSHMMTRMLTVSQVMSGKAFHVDLQSGSFHLYPYLTIMAVRDMLYLHSVQKLLVSRSKPNIIISTSINETASKVFYPYHARCMAADEERKYLFISFCNSTVCRFKKLNIDNGRPQGISKVSKYFARSLAVDKKRTSVYAAVKTSLLAFTYDFMEFRVIDKGTNIFAVTVDACGDRIFYNKLKNMYIRSLIRNTSTKVTSYRHNVWKFRFHDSRVYVSYEGNGQISVWKDNEKNRDLNKGIPFPGKLLICPIP